MMNFKERSRTMTAFNEYNARMNWAREFGGPVWDAGKSWYGDANDALADATAGANLSTYRLAGVASLLSPMTPWERNLSAAIDLADAYSSRASHETLLGIAKRGTVYNNNASAAVRYLAGDDTQRPTGAKTGPFHANLAGDLGAVTIDSHMCDAVDMFGLASLTGNARRSMQRAVRMCATLHGIPNAQAQAIVWTVQRDNLGPAR